MRRISIGMACAGVIIVFSAYHVWAGRATAAPFPVPAPVTSGSITFVKGAEAVPPPWPETDPPEKSFGGPVSAFLLCAAGAPLLNPAPNDLPVVQVWSQGDALAGRVAKGCTKWLPDLLTLNIALTGSFSYRGSASDLLAQFGKVSSLSGVRYWSATDKRWEVMIPNASAISGTGGAPRPDFTAGELKSGKDFYFSQQDNRSSRPVIYRMRVDVHTSKRLVIRIANVTSLYFFMIPIFKPGDIQFAYILEPLSPQTWGCFGLLGVRGKMGVTSASQKESWINRALAMYSHFTGVRIDQKPPLVQVGNR